MDPVLPGYNPISEEDAAKKFPGLAEWYETMGHKALDWAYEDKYIPNPPNPPAEPPPSNQQDIADLLSFLRDHFRTLVKHVTRMQHDIADIISIHRSSIRVCIPDGEELPDLRELRFHVKWLYESSASLSRSVLQQYCALDAGDHVSGYVQDEVKDVKSWILDLLQRWLKFQRFIYVGINRILHHLRQQNDNFWELCNIPHPTDEQMRAMKTGSSTLDTVLEYSDNVMRAMEEFRKAHEQLIRGFYKLETLVDCTILRDAAYARHQRQGGDDRASDAARQHNGSHQTQTGPSQAGPSQVGSDQSQSIQALDRQTIEAINQKEEEKAAGGKLERESTLQV